MKKINLLGILPVIMLALFSTSVLASTVNIPTFTVKTSTVKKNIGQNDYSMTTKIKYQADVEGVSFDEDQFSAKYEVTPALSTASIGSTFSPQMLQFYSPYVCGSLNFTARYAINGTYNFYVTGKSGTVINSAILS